MTRGPSLESFHEVLEHIAQRIADRVADKVVVRMAESSSPSEWYNQHENPLGKRRFLESARRGAFASTRRGKLVLARRKEVDAWLTLTERRRATDSVATNDAAANDTDALLQRAGVIGTAGPARRRGVRVR